MAPADDFFEGIHFSAPTIKKNVNPGCCSEDEQIDFEVEFFDRVLERNPCHLDVLRRQVELLVHRGEYQRALDLDARLVRLVPHDCVARYNLACTLSLLDRVEEAMEALDLALAHGYQDIAHLEADADLDNIRSHPGYVELLAKHGVDDWSAEF